MLIFHTGQNDPLYQKARVAPERTPYIGEMSASTPLFSRDFNLANSGMIQRAAGGWLVCSSGKSLSPAPGGGAHARLSVSGEIVVKSLTRKRQLRARDMSARRCRDNTDESEFWNLPIGTSICGCRIPSEVVRLNVEAWQSSADGFAP
ncbi:MAG: hypothetical protein R3E61_06690 [Pseudomonadales bacterium]